MQKQKYYSEDECQKKKIQNTYGNRYARKIFGWEFQKSSERPVISRKRKSINKTANK